MRAQAAAAETAGALSLRTWFAEAEAAASIARQVADTPFVPDSLKRWVDPNEKDLAKRVLDLDSTVAVVTAALLAGQELGFPPMASLRSMDVIKGTPALRAMALRALVQAHGHTIAVIETNGTRAVVRGCRASDGQVQEATWTLDRARLLGLYPGPEYGQWRKQPQAQLVARATAEVARWIGADAILGLYTAEELADDGAGVVEAAESAAEPAGPAGTSPSPPARRRAPRALAAPQVPMPPPPNEPPPPPRIGRDQITALNAALKSLGVSTRADAVAVVRRHLDRDISKAEDLTYDEAVKVLAALADEAAAAAARAEQDAQPGPDEGSAGDAPDA